MVEITMITKLPTTKTNPSRIALLVVVVLLSTTAAVAPASAQSVDDAADAVDDAVDTDTDDVTNETEQLLYQFEGGGALRSVDYRDGSTWVTLAATDGSQRFAVSEGDLGETGSFEYMTVSVDAGETRTVELPVSQSAVVVTTTQDGFYYQGSSGPPVTTNRPTDGLLQIGAGTGGVGALAAVSLQIGRLRRKKENKITEMFSDETQRIQENRYEGWREKIVGWFENRYESKLSTAAGVALLGYIGLVALGVAPAPGDLWISLSDANRVILVGVALMTAAAWAPAGYLVNKIYNPSREYILNIDAVDTYKSAAGNAVKEISLHSVPPKRVSEVDFEGSPDKVGTPGDGDCIIARDYDPKEQTAAANPPTLHSDIACILSADLILANRNKLNEYADMSRKAAALMPSIKRMSDVESTLEIDSKWREDIAVGNQDGTVGVMSEIVEGTEYEEIYESDDNPLDLEDMAAGSGGDTPTPGGIKTDETDDTTNDSDGGDQ